MCWRERVGDLEASFQIERNLGRGDELGGGGGGEREREREKGGGEKEGEREREEEEGEEEEEEEEREKRDGLSSYSREDILNWYL